MCFLHDQIYFIDSEYAHFVAGIFGHINGIDHVPGDQSPLQGMVYWCISDECKSKGDFLNH